MKFSYIYSSNKNTDDESYACVNVDIEVLNWLKSMVEDLIVDYARVQNFGGIEETVKLRKKIVQAIDDLTPDPIPEAEEQTDAQE